MIFFAGAPNPTFLKHTDAPLFVAMTALARYKNFPRRAPALDGEPAACAIDAGTFHAMSKHGRLPFGVPEYADLARRACAEVGGVVRVASLDYMCEPHILAKSGLTVREHQQRTIDNLLALRDLAPEVPWMPCLQGWSRAEYLGHVDQYRRAGVDLRAEPLVGLGSVCRRQDTDMAEGLVCELVAEGLSLHLLGFKVEGLARFAHLLGDVYQTRPEPHVQGVGRVVSYDTQADLAAARRAQKLPPDVACRRKLMHPDCARKLIETGRGARTCASCLPFILMKRAQRLSELAAAPRASARFRAANRFRQLDLFAGAA